MRPYIILPHTADLRLKIFGKTKKELFFNAVRGMFLAIEPTYKKGAPEVERLVRINSKDIDALLIDFLSEVLYLSDIHDEAYNKIKIKRLNNKSRTFLGKKVRDQEIEVIIFGKKVKGFREEIKAVTYHGAHIKKTKAGWEVEIIFDI